jgi:hypothetical protein
LSGDAAAIRPRRVLRRRAQQDLCPVRDDGATSSIA